MAQRYNKKLETIMLIARLSIFTSLVIDWMISLSTRNSAAITQKTSIWTW